MEKEIFTQERILRLVIDLSRDHLNWFQISKDSFLDFPTKWQIELGENFNALDEMQCCVICRNFTRSNTIFINIATF